MFWALVLLPLFLRKPLTLCLSSHCTQVLGQLPCPPHPIFWEISTASLRGWSCAFQSSRPSFPSTKWKLTTILIPPQHDCHGNWIAVQTTSCPNSITAPLLIDGISPSWKAVSGERPWEGERKAPCVQKQLQFKNHRRLSICVCIYTYIYFYLFLYKSIGIGMALHPLSDVHFLFPRVSYTVQG